MDDTLGAVSARGRPHPPGLLGERRGEGVVQIKRVCASLRAATKEGAEDAQTAVRPPPPQSPAARGLGVPRAGTAESVDQSWPPPRTALTLQPAVPGPRPGSVLPCWVLRP